MIRLFVGALLAICLATGAFLAGRYGGAWAGVRLGLLVGLLNLLVLGSLLSGEDPGRGRSQDRMARAAA